ncbi:putative Flc2 FAD transporter, partial [Cryphonectria parasitica EP155]
MTVTFDLSGTSTVEQNVTAQLNVTAYGYSVYSSSFNPCEATTYVEQLCPVPAGTFSASGTQSISSQYASQIPAIAFTIPDIAASATLELKSLDTGDDVGCISSQISNGKTTAISAVSYTAAAVAGVALVMSGFTAASSALAGGGASTGAGPSPSFIEVMTWFQGMAMNGMSSVGLPSVYRQFSKNFAFSVGLINFEKMQLAIDDFRQATGGNTTDDSVQYLQNATLVFSDGSMETLGSDSKVKRAMAEFYNFVAREITTSVDTNDTTTTNTTTSSNSTSSVTETVNGIKAYVEDLSIPNANTFMTVLLIVACVMAAIILVILLIKVVLEAWALFGKLPKGLTGFREHYWVTMGRLLTQLIMLLYSTWVLYCMYQFIQGDSWAAKLLAGLTLALFTGVLAFFAYKVTSTAKKLQQADGDASGLYEKKDLWIKYKVFYDSYKKSYWWLFIPVICYMFAKGVVMAAGDNHPMGQSIAQFIVEAFMLIVLVWNRPFERKSGNVLNISIQVVRILSVICIFVFVDELGIQETTKSVVGIVLLVIQAVLTGILAIMIIWNAFISIFKENPHRKRRKEMEKMRDLDNLTPLDARNSLLLDRKTSHQDSDTFSLAKTNLD